MSSPRIVWAPRLAHLEARQASIGQNGQVIVCTAMGEVYIGAPSGPNENGEYRFNKIPFLQRCIYVSANPSGAFAAIRAEYKASKQQAIIPHVSDHLVSALPHKAVAKMLDEQIKKFDAQKQSALEELRNNQLAGEYGHDKNIKNNHSHNHNHTDAWKSVENLSRDDATLDLVFVVQNRRIYLHKFFLSSRLRFLIGGGSSNNRSGGGDDTYSAVINNPERSEIHLATTHLESFLLVDYLYSDNYAHPMSTLYKSPLLCRASDIPTATAAAAGTATAAPFLVVRPLDVQKGLINLAEELDLAILLDSAQSTFNHTPQSSLLTDLELLLTNKVTQDVQLNLKDGEVLFCHELIVRQRCPFFEALFCPGSVWMEERREANRTNAAVDGNNGTPAGNKQSYLPVDLGHVPVEVMASVLEYLYTGHNEVELFGKVAKNTVEEMVEFLMEVLCVADELLLPDLKALCERSLIDFISLRTAVVLLERADACLANLLKQECLGFIGANLSTFITCGMLEYTDNRLVGYLEEHVQSWQAQERKFSGIQRDLAQVDSKDREMDDPEFSTSLYALSLEDMPIISSQRDILVTVYPKKPAVPDHNEPSRASLAIKDKKPKAAHVSSQKKGGGRGREVFGWILVRLRMKSKRSPVV
ncbi:hypothetical protein J3Q64DRAFT_1638125 [Phycomyces blakesleeanus]|uniref:BTB domain-containing protein n=1 Tax=Phycomyces blakesleeanus TaxID=4837 RepID=A0ABR3B2Y6_PHYBL